MAGEDITINQLRQLLGVQAELREQVECRWQRAQRSLVSLLESFPPEEVDRRLKTGQGLDSLGVDGLAQLLSQQFNARLQQTRAMQNEGERSQTLQALKNQLQTDKSEMEGLRVENRSLAEEAKMLRAERDGLQSQLAALQQVTAAHDLQSILHPNGQWLLVMLVILATLRSLSIYAVIAFNNPDNFLGVSAHLVGRLCGV